MRVRVILLSALLVSACSPTAVHQTDGEALTETPTSGFTAAPTLTVSDPTPQPGEVVTLSATGGVPPYAFSLVSGNGTLDTASQTFTTSATAGLVQLGVTDSAGYSGYANLNVTVSSGGTTGGSTSTFIAAPLSGTITPNSTLTFTASGGTAPYSMALIAGSGTVAGMTFTASAAQGSVTLMIMDSAAHSQTATITVQSNVSTTPATISFNITVDQFLAISFDNFSGADHPYFGFLSTGPAADAASAAQFTPVTLGNYSNAAPAGVAYRGTIQATGRNASVGIEYCIPPVHKGYAFVRAVSGSYSFKTLLFNQTATPLFEGGRPATTAFLNLDTASGTGTVSVTLTGGYSDSVDCSDYDGTQYVDVGQQ